ncbi:MFS transporter [Propionivibrio sp.]|uniref:MFS transporter n=1 Tax=Propionivibrio sp. TaxID=2212460 RepID=UPI0039E43D82
MKEQNSRAIAFTVAAAFFMETLDASIITTALPAIGAGFGTTALGVSASVTVYLVAMAVFVPAAGWCGERYGARRVFAAAVGVFTFASLLCGLAPSLWTLIAARTLQGAAAAFMSPVGRFVVLRETPQNRIIEAIATITWPGLIAPVLGPPLGGFIVSHVSWHWIFLINVPLGAIGVWLVLRYIPYRAPTRQARFDTQGFVLTALSLAALVEGLAELGERHGGRTWPLLLIAVGIAAGVAAVRHARRTPDPMLDLRALAVPTFALAVASAGFISRVAINASPFLLPLMFQIGFGMSPTQAGLMVLVYMAGNLLMKSATTPVLRRFGFRRVLTVERRAVHGDAGGLRPARAGPPHAADLRGAAGRRNDPLDELHHHHHAGLRRRERRAAGRRQRIGDDVPAGGDDPRRGLRGVRAGRLADAARGAVARAGRLPLRVVRHRPADGAGDRRRPAPRPRGGRHDFRQAALSAGSQRRSIGT